MLAGLMIKIRLSFPVFYWQTYAWNADVIFVPDMHVLDGHLDVVEKFCEERRNEALVFCAVFCTFNGIDITTILSSTMLYLRLQLLACGAPQHSQGALIWHLACDAPVRPDLRHPPCAGRQEDKRLR
jgi:hypothetical protein